MVINCSIFSTNKTVHVSGLFLDKVTSVKGLTLSPDISGIKFLFSNLPGKYIANDVLFYRPVVSWRSPRFTILLNLYFWSGSQMIAQFTEKLPVLSGHLSESGGCLLNKVHSDCFAECCCFSCKGNPWSAGTEFFNTLMILFTILNYTCWYIQTKILQGKLCIKFSTVYMVNMFCFLSNKVYFHSLSRWDLEWITPSQRKSLVSSFWKNCSD